MNSRREFREIVKTCREGSAQQPLFPKLFGALRLFIFFFFFSSNAFSQNLGNQQYDLNDPRNPDCPCHKLQKLADDEYNKILYNDIQQQFASNLNVKVPNNNLNVQINNPLDNNEGNNLNFLNNNFNQVDKVDNVGNDNSSHQAKRDFSPNKSNSSIGTSSSGSKAKKKNSGSWLRKKLYKAKLKNSKIKKVRPNYSVCYKW